jgi:GR25 family glycosyltransferase involved in LPS biosynthesis
MQCFVINLTADSERMAHTNSVLERHSFIKAERIDAVRGSSLPDIAGEMLTGKPESKNHKGVLGCSLSHAAAWEKALRAGTEWSLILEDDSDAESLEKLRDFQLSSDIDLVFCNGRMVYQQTGIALLPILPAFAFITRNNTGVGTDGYLISHRGARKLLEFFARDGFYSHVDLRLAAYSLTLEEIETLPQREYIIRDICILRRIYDATHHLTARVLGVAITRHVKGASSSRKAEDERGGMG